MPPKASALVEEQEARLADLEDQLTDLLDDIKATASIGGNLQATPSKQSLFTARLSRIDSTYDRFHAAFLEAKALARKLDKSPSKYNQQKEEARTLFYEALSFSANTTSDNSRTDADRSMTLRSAEPVRHPRLPTISIPSFSGDIASWQNFREIFRSLVHENDNVEEVQKFHYLKSSLKGSALQTIAAISISPEGYKQAWDALIQKYDSKRIQAMFYLTRILNFKPIVKGNLSSLENFSSVILESASALFRLDIADLAGFIISTLALRLLDSKTRECFEREHSSKSTLPTWQEFEDFIHQTTINLQSDALITCTAAESVQPKSGYGKSSKQVLITTDSVTKTTKCPICNKVHRIYDCPRFKTYTPQQRCDQIKRLNRCINCFALGHLANSCSSRVSCRHCDRRHHSLLHFFSRESRKSEANSPQSRSCSKSDDSAIKLEQTHAPDNSSVTRSSDPTGTKSAILSMSAEGRTDVLLGTAIARIRDNRGHWQDLRILIDSGSQRSFITEDCARRLSLNLKRSKHQLVGFSNQTIPRAKFEAACVIVPRDTPSPKLNVMAIVIKQICQDMPTSPVPSKVVEKFRHLNLADPQFHYTRPVDFLLGADVFAGILRAGNIKSDQGIPSALETIFGWILIGSIDENACDKKYHSINTLHSTAVPCSQCDDLSLAHVLNKFWEVENIANVSKSDPQDEQCEAHFVTTHSRAEAGCFIVRLPFKDSPPDLSDSRYGALNRFKNLEHKFEKNPALRCEYSKVIQEYWDKGYISHAMSPGKCYLPHHAVLKDSLSTKLRIVFDASASSSGGSLNDCLLTGPKLQRDIKDVMLGFRKPRIAISADICQMYLQIRLAPEDCAFHHFFYRFEATDALTEYKFNRLPFGLSCSPFLALRVIKQLVLEDGKNYPEASRALLEHMYIDDLLTGMDTIPTACALQRDLTHLLEKGGFELKKWSSNCPQILDNVQSETESPVSFSNMEDTVVKILGIQWEPKHDCLSYKVQPRECVLTKRGIMSTIARIYDPLGYLAPAVFKAKTILQKLWETKLDWDTPIPPVLGKSWETFCDNLACLRQIRIPRCIFVEDALNVTIVGFADASSLGYAAVVYIHLELSNGGYASYLLYAKTRLAPLKPLSIPRLELCAALLLVDALKSLDSVLSHWNVTSTILCSDSSTVLSWLHLPYSRLKTFVANRVARIVQRSELISWNHVTSENNAADVASRGICPSELPSHSTWWNGPAWLRGPKNEWPISSNHVIMDPCELPETKTTNAVALVAANPGETDLDKILDRFSSYARMIRVMAYVLRFVNNASKRNCVRSGSLTLMEIRQATVAVVRGVQLAAGLSTLHGERMRPLKSLNPFVDPAGLVRVGGRLRLASLPYDTKHPMLLPTKSHLVNLLIDHFHRVHLHAGPQLLHSLLRNRFWILAGRGVVRSRVHGCATCHRLRVKPLNPLMGDLPQSRFEQGRAFLNVGIDFAGPFFIRESSRRKAALSKAYVCLFVCFSTKAVHIEAVTQLSTDAFMACFDRFVARRGLPSKIFSDNGTNFVGASNRLKELYKWWRSQEFVDKATSYFTAKEVVWHFIPPLAPHFGGLWEAGVKACKHHLTRVLGTQPVTFEELATILSRVEAVLNSRPLHPLSSDPEDYQVLTPGHFLVGAPLVASPEHDLTDVPHNRLSRWQHLQQCLGNFWKRWRLDYLHSLQQRTKWTDPTTSIEPGTLVLLRDPNVPPLNWPTARVTETHPGKDGIVRVVRLRTEKAEILRPVSRLSPLFPEDTNTFSMFRKANVVCMLAIDKSSKDELFKESNQENVLRQRQKKDKANLVKMSSGITDQLLSISRHLSDTTQLSADTLNTLANSSTTVSGTNEELHETKSVLFQSGKLLAKYSRRQFTDKLLLLLGFAFFMACVLYVLKKRVF